MNCISWSPVECERSGNKWNLLQPLYRADDVRKISICHSHRPPDTHRWMFHACHIRRSSGFAGIYTQHYSTIILIWLNDIWMIFEWYLNDIWMIFEWYLNACCLALASASDFSLRLRRLAQLVDVKYELNSSRKSPCIIVSFKAGHNNRFRNLSLSKPVHFYVPCYSNCATLVRNSDCLLHPLPCC